jgi:hypoxanthine phosphoribosyltransferase
MHDDVTLFSQARIARRVKAVAREIARGPLRPDIAVPILAGAFVFAADLLRALAREGLDLETEFIWLRTYGRAETPGEVAVLKRPTEIVRGRTIL